MNHSIKYLSLLLILGITLTGCENLSPLQNGLGAATAAGAATAIPLGVSHVNPGITIPVAIGSALLAGGAGYFISKKQQENRQQPQAQPQTQTQQAVQQSTPPAQSGQACMTTYEQKPAFVNYIAAKAPGSPLYGAPKVCIYNNQTGELATKKMYQLYNSPSLGDILQLGEYQCKYVGSLK